MKQFIKYILNHVPRPILQRIAGWAVPIMGLWYIGKGKECPLCGCRRRKFLPYGYVTQRDNALCPNCLALERHRTLWLWLLRESDIGRGAMALPRLLHVAPEVALMRKFSRIYAKQPADYVTADLESPLADLHFDIQHIPLEDESFDVVICNHIMEHVEDDRLAMREILRIMRKGGWGVILSPVDLQREKTFEDDTITDEAERTRIFGQYDHRRIYGRDYAERLREAGFEVYECDYANLIPAKEKQLYALTDEPLYIVRKP
ncbi:MAG: methyltransferase domain-containing protein [Alistipes sp.]|nr:methyltransferase domain-containing protein [Alistipes sp.]MBP3564485.1 methyltransferase domain-containing protein [Alistipes sp.]